MKLSDRRPLTLFVLPFVLLLGARAAADVSDPPSAAQSAWMHGVGLEADPDGVTVRGAGPGYRVELDARGVHYTAALGPEARESAELGFALESIRLGERELDLGAPVAPAVDGLVASYARGSAVREEYALQSDGLWQRFVFDELPRGGGDLVVRGRIDTRLAARALDGALSSGAPLIGAKGDGLRFETSEGGSFVYGGVTGIDARGARVSGELRLDGDVLELSLPADFVATAALPLVLDPLLGGNTTVGTTPFVRLPDIAYDVTNDLYLAVWEVRYSDNNIDVYGQRVSPSGNLIGNLVLIEPFSNFQSEEPTVANNNGSDRFLVAWEQYPSGLGGSNDLVATIVQASTGALTNRLQFAISGQHPVAGGETVPGFAGVQVVWEDAGIKGRTLLVPPSGDPGFATSYVLSSNPDHYGVAMSRSGGQPGRYLVTWYGAGVSPTGFSDVYARTVTYNGIVDSALANLTHTADIEDANPSTDGDGVDFVIAYERFDHELWSDDIACKRVHWNDGGTLTWNEGDQFVQKTPAQELEPQVCMLGGAAVLGGAQKYAVAWREQTEALTMPLRYRELDPSTCTSCGTLQTLGGDENTVNYWVALASEADGGSDGSHDGGFAVFVRAVALGGQQSLAGQAFEAFGTSGTVVDLGGGCAGGGVASVSGPVALGNKGFEYRLSGAAPSAMFAIHNMSFAPTPFPCGSCAGILPGILHTRALVGGAASFASPVPCNSSALGIVLESDWIVFTVPGTPCPAFAGFANSNVLRLTIGE